MSRKPLIENFPAQSGFKPGDMVEFWYRQGEQYKISDHDANGCLMMIVERPHTNPKVHQCMPLDGPWVSGYKKHGIPLNDHYLKLVEPVVIEGDDDDDCI